MARRLFLLFLVFSFVLALGVGIFYISFKRTMSEEDTTKDNNQSGNTQLTLAKEELFSFVVFGDTEIESTEENTVVFQKIIKATNSSKVPFVIHTGDITAQGTRAQFKQFDKLLENLLPSFYPALGNNDIATDKSGKYFESYFDKSYYSFDYRNRHFVILDNASAYYGFDKKQRKWLKDDLILNDGKKLILVMHRPLNVPNADLVIEGGNELSEANIRAFLEIIEPYKDKIEQIFTGHIHGFLQYKINEEIPVTITGGGGAEPQFDFIQTEPHYLLVKVYIDRIKIEKKEIKL